VFNKRNKSWIAISINAKVNTIHSNNNLTRIQRSMKPQSKRRCWWSLKRIDLLLRLIVLKQTWAKSKKMKMTWLEEQLIKVKLILVLPKHKVPNSLQVDKVQENNRPLPSKWEELESQVLASSALLTKRNLLQFQRLIHKTHILMKIMNLAILTWVKQKFSKVILWVLPVWHTTLKKTF